MVTTIAAAGLVEDDDVALDAPHELLDGGEDAAARAGAVARGDALGPAVSSARIGSLHLQLAGGLVPLHLHEVW